MKKLRQIRNPFIPDRPASSIEKCHGREEQIDQLTRASMQGCCAVVGPYGIGKSSLIGTTVPYIESNANVIALQLGPEIETCDSLARNLISQIVTEASDTVNWTIQVGLPKVAKVKLQSQQYYTYYKEGLHLQALMQLIENIEYEPDVPIIFCLDQCELAPKPLALLMRGLQSLSLKGRENVNIVVAGNPPFIEEMAKTEPRIHNFIPVEIELGLLTLEDSRDLVQDLFDAWCVKVADETGVSIDVEPTLATRIAILAGRHPLLLQLIGHRVIENEVSSNDCRLDEQDLSDFIETICSKQGRYSRIVEQLKVDGIYDSLVKLLTLATGVVPTMIDCKEAINLLGKEEVNRLISMGHIYIHRDSIRLIDELFRFRILLDRGKVPQERIEAIETRLIAADIVEGELYDIGFGETSD